MNRSSSNRMRSKRPRSSNPDGTEVSPIGRADGAEQDGVEAPQLLEDGVGQHVAGPQVAGGAEVVVGGVERDPGGGHDLQGLGEDLGADAVAADDGDPVGAHRGRRAGCGTRVSGCNVAWSTAVTPVRLRYRWGSCRRPIAIGVRSPGAPPGALFDGTRETKNRPQSGRSRRHAPEGACLLNDRYGASGVRHQGFSFAHLGPAVNRSPTPVFDGGTPGAPAKPVA